MFDIQTRRLMFEDSNIENALEAILFVSSEALKTSQLAEIFNKDESEITEALEGLQKQYEVKESGIVLKRIAGG